MNPTMFRGATLSFGEAELLRSITDVVRLGHVRHIAHDAISHAREVSVPARAHPEGPRAGSPVHA